MKILLVFVSLAYVFLVTVVCQEPEIKAECKPGEFYHDGCNMCWCGKIGLYACTLRGCPQGMVPPKICTPGATFNRSCNSCICNEKGNGGTCTTQQCNGEDN